MTKVEIVPESAPSSPAHLAFPGPRGLRCSMICMPLMTAAYNIWLTQAYRGFLHPRNAWGSVDHGGGYSKGELIFLLVTQRRDSWMGGYYRSTVDFQNICVIICKSLHFDVSLFIFTASRLNCIASDFFFCHELHYIVPHSSMC